MCKYVNRNVSLSGHVAIAMAMFLAGVVICVILYVFTRCFGVALCYVCEYIRSVHTDEAVGGVRCTFYCAVLFAHIAVMNYVGRARTVWIINGKGMVFLCTVWKYM
jgi:hypothetical protein